MGLFLLFVPRLYLESVLIPCTNAELVGGDFSLGELLVFIGLWLLMSTTMCTNRKDFWDATPASEWTKAPFRVNHYMTQKRFECIIKPLTYTDAPPTNISRQVSPDEADACRIQ